MFEIERREQQHKKGPVQTFIETCVYGALGLLGVLLLIMALTGLAKGVDWIVAFEKSQQEQAAPNRSRATLICRQTWFSREIICSQP